MREILFLCCSFLLINCTAPKKYIDLTSHPLKAKNIRLDIKSLENWQHKDIIEDTIPGISLDKAYRELLKNKKGNKILVAVIDTSTDINHEDLTDIIWVNYDEIPNNDIDDDGNGYIDDVHGWNFIGNQKGENILYCNLESSRIIKHFKNKFEGKKEENIPIEDQKKFIKYQNALLEYKKSYNVIMEEKKYGDSIRAGYKNAVKLLQPFFKNNQYIVSQLDSLAMIHKEDRIIEGAIFFMKNYLAKEISTESVSNYFQIIDDQIKTIYNENYNDRIIIGDNPDDLSDIKYGNNNVSILAKELQHGTKIAGVIGASRNNSIGINGIYNNLELMILPIAAYCNENDKDVALAIRYAVDNGAKVINMSFGKNISLREEWVREAIVYAEEHDVLMVSGAGNDSVDLDVHPFFPTDVDENGEEFSSNFIKVGSISYYTKEWFVSYFSNYGKKNVDLFAPGHDLFTTVANNKYEFDSGTSLSAPIVSGVAALIRSYYPTLTAAEVKSIILESGISYDIMVNRPAENGSNDKIHFSELSKSGKVVNAYNALLMAKEVAKKKKKKRA